MEKNELSKLAHILWKQKSLYERALELTEMSLIDENYICMLNEILKEIKEINKDFIEKRIKEL